MITTSKGREAIASLQSERQANAILTEENEGLRAQVDKLEELCDATYVAQGADAYNHACSEMERHQSARVAAGKDPGTTGSLCDGLSWLYAHVDLLESERDELRAQVEALSYGREAITEAAVVLADSRKTLDGLSEFLTDNPQPLKRPAVPEGWVLRSPHGDLYRPGQECPDPGLIWAGRPAWRALYAAPQPEAAQKGGE